MSVRVFISHSSQDKPQVEALAFALRERGIDPWLDKWQIGPGDDIVASINRGLDEADAGIVVFSEHSRKSKWVDAEVSYLTYARIQEGKALIPVVLGDGVWVPALLRPLARRGIEEVDAITDALFNRRARPAPATAPEFGKTERVLVFLRREGDGGVRVTLSIRDRQHAGFSYPGLPPALVEAQAEFLRGVRPGVRRNPTAAERASQESGLVQLGRALRTFCLPGDSGEALATVVDGAIGTTVEVCFEAEDPALLGLPFEALRLPDDRPLVLQPSVVMFRRPGGVTVSDGEPLAGPLKVLVAVGAPDEGNTGSVVLEQERELQNILDAVTVAQRHKNVEVRILEVGHPDQIAAAIEIDAYHILHVSCHGSPGILELEDEEGRGVPTTADGLVEPIRGTHRPLPLVLLNACHGGVSDGQTASLAEALLRAGVPAVLAMQTSVSDFYATEFARAFYHHLSSREHHLASRALAAARKELERSRREAAERGASLAETQPEFATASLYVAGEERPLADFSREKQPLTVRPVYQVAGPVPQLRIDDLIGRRKELRETLRTLRDPSRRHAGVVLTGIGGVGKSAVAGRVMQRLSEAGWLVPAYRGRFDLKAIALALGAELIQTDRPETRKLGHLLAADDVDDRLRPQLVAKALAEEPVLLVLDDFEQNLQTDGGEFRDPDVRKYLRLLAENARRGRLLLTCRHPVQGMEDLLRRVSVGPLSRAETLKLLQRLEELRGRELSDVALVLRVIGGHPRMLEFLDALLQGGQGRLPHVTEKLRDVLATGDADAVSTATDLEEGIAAAVTLGARDVLLSELLGIVRGKGIDEALLQVATSNLPVEPAGLARMFADDRTGNPTGAAHALKRLEDLSLVHRFPDGSAWVHRWTAEGLAGLVDAGGHRARHVRAGRYRWWRVENESHSLEDAVEAVRNFLAGDDFDAAVGVAGACFDALRRLQQSIGIAALAAEVLEALPESHSGFVVIADEEVKAHLVLGFTERALARCEDLLARHEGSPQAEPDRADYQRDLSVLYERVSDLYSTLGQGERARQAKLVALQIRERLAQVEPDRADYQRDLAASHQRLGDLYRDFGMEEQACRALLTAHQIVERLTQAEPDRADYQRDLAASHQRLADLYRDLGLEEQARQAILATLQITERLTQAEPDRADYQYDLAVSFNKVGDLYRDLGQGEQAHQAFLTSVQIFTRLAQAEPDRTDYQRDLSASLNKLGDLYRDFGQSEQARNAFLTALQIVERLVQAEPNRADYRHDLSVSYERVGDICSDLGQGLLAQQAFLASLQIRERLAQVEPDRVDYQYDLARLYQRLGDLYRDLGQGEEARQTFVNFIQLFERLVQAEPDHTDYQLDLAVGYTKAGDLYCDLGQEEEARQAFATLLQITERLAQAEPDRVDYQRNLVLALGRVGSMDDDTVAGKATLQRALTILEAMQSRGQLAPADRLVEWVNRLVRKLEGG